MLRALSALEEDGIQCPMLMLGYLCTSACNSSYRGLIPFSDLFWNQDTHINK